MDVAEALKKMNSQRGIGSGAGKGTYGEEAVIAVLKDYAKLMPHTIFHSYTYPLASDRSGRVYPGNIKRNGDSYYEVTGDGLIDEIDVLFITDYRVFVIEIKARSGNWKIFDHWASQGGRIEEKSPITQTEKHSRHLYHTIYEYLPDGNPNYIVPITVFVDKAKISDTRSREYKQYIRLAILNNLKQVVSTNNTPLNNAKIAREELVRHLINKGKGTRY